MTKKRIATHLLVVVIVRSNNVSCAVLNCFSCALFIIFLFEKFPCMTHERLLFKAVCNVVNTNQLHTIATYNSKHSFIYSLKLIANTLRVVYHYLYHYVFRHLEISH